MISIIATVGKNNEIGNDNKLIWDLKDINKFLKKLTINQIVIMGKNTFNIYHLLPNRYNIVLSNTLDNTNGVEISNSTEDILKRFKEIEEEVFILGGESLYKSFIEYANKIYLTEIDDESPADKYFPSFDKEEFKRIELDNNEENGVKYTHVLYVRK